MLWPMTKTCVDQSELVNVGVKIDQLTICLGPSTIGKNVNYFTVLSVYSRFYNLRFMNDR